MTILDLIGWYKSSSDTFTLRARVTQDGGDDSKYTIEANGPWVPKAGDVVTDSADQVDTVMSVEDSLTYFGVVGASGWTDGFATIVRKTGARPHTVDFRGIARAFDNTLTKATDLALNSGNSITDALAVSTTSYAPAGWAYASIVEIDPQSDELFIRTAHWHAPQGVKRLINVSTTNRFVVTHNSGVSIPEEAIQCPGAANIAVGPGDSVTLVRDTQGSNDQWRLVEAQVLNPMTILGPACKWWALADKRLDGAAPDIAELYNIAPPGSGNVLQSSAGKRPHLLSISSVDYADFDGSDDVMVVGESEAGWLWPAAATDVTLWILCRFDDFASAHCVVDMGTATANQGISITADTTGIEVRVTAGSSTTTLTHAYSDTGIHLFTVNYNGTLITLLIDGSSVATQAKTGTMDNAGTALAIGDHFTQADAFNGAFRGGNLMLGTATGDENTAMTAYWLAQI